MSKPIYEYVSFRAQNAAEKDGDVMLNKMGSAGWRLVVFCPAPEVEREANSTPQWDYIFERTKDQH